MAELGGESGRVTTDSRMTDSPTAATDSLAADLASPRSVGIDKPFWREHQRETVEEALGLFAGHKVVLLDAPTGSGKTVTGGALGGVYGRAIYLTETIGLQTQYLATLDGAVTATGRRNHICPLARTVRGEPVTADDAPCPCPVASSSEPCSYYAQWFDAEEARDAVLNYAYAVRVLQAGGIRFGKEQGDVMRSPFRGRDLMVCDEGHLLERALRSAGTIELFANSMKRAGVRVPAARNWSTEEWRGWARTELSRCAEEWGPVDEAFEVAVTTTGQVSVSSLQDVRRIKSARNVLRQLSQLRDAVLVVPSSFGWRFEPLWVWDGLANDLLFRHVPRVLVMSATLGSPALLVRLLGFGEEEWAEIHVQSTFPVARRPVYYWPVAKMSAKTGEWEQSKIIGALNYVATLGRFATRKGVVHCASYRLAKWIYTHEDLDPAVRARMIVHDSEHREEAFRQFTTAVDSDPAILVSPAAWTGVDWPYHHDWQFIPKVPFADLTDDVTRARFEYVDERGERIGRKVYAHEAASTLVQGVGRGVRAEDDRCVTVIADKNFWTLYRHTAPEAFPEWFRASVSWYKPKEVKS